MTTLSDATVGHLKEIVGWPAFTSDRYVAIEEIGRGGMGTVYAARDTALERDVAIKIGNALPGADLQARLTGEARAIARLEHPGIVPVHDYGLLADGRPFYVMKRVHGRSLQALVESGLAPAEALRIFERVCEAVSFAHARGVLHRDLKPSNVMVGAFGEVMVTDWTVAAATGTVVGTRGFMAPEQEAGGGTADARADVYSLGAMLGAMLGDDAPRPLRSICRLATEREAVRRYESVEALAADIRRFRDGEAVHAHRENTLERAARLGRKYQLPILLVLGYIVMRAVIALLAGI